MQSENYVPRFSFEVTLEQKALADKLLPFGLRKAIFSKLLDDVLDMIENNGPGSLGVLLSGVVKPREIISTLFKAEEAGKVENETTNNETSDNRFYHGQG